VYFFGGIVHVTIYAFFFTGLFFRHGFAAAAFINTIFSVAIWTAAVGPALAITVNISMITMFMILTMVAYHKELVSRQLFVSETKERETLVRQNQKDTRHLAWLRQLAAFLRHEVRQPIAQITSSVELIQLAHHDDRMELYIASASVSARDVWNLVERASQATDAEAFVRQANPHWINLGRLLAEQTDAFRQTNSGIDFHLRCPSVVGVYADPTLIKEAIGNVLGNAASYALEDSIIEVLLQVDEVWAIMKVTNKGPPIEGDTELLFGPFASTRAGPSSEHQGLGLYLVRLIAEQHGGTANISNLADGSGVVAMISVPLAPYGSSTQR
jgi:signal transduction histidine kinase